MASAGYRVEPRIQRLLLHGRNDGYRWGVAYPNGDFLCATYRKDEAVKIAAALNKTRRQRNNSERTS